MVERIKLWFYNHKTWIYNTQYIIYSIFLLVLVIIVDLGFHELKSYIPNVFFTSVSLAKTILAALAGAQLTITTFTFSTILTVMSNYTSNYSSRVIENFVEEKITMKVLGIFFGGFFYSITALVFMRDQLESDMVVAGFVGVIYAIVSMVYFIIFVQKVIWSSSSDNLINSIYKESLPVVEEEIDKRKEYSGGFTDRANNPIKLYSNTSGFLSVIDHLSITKILKEKKCELIIDSKIGDFINEERPLAHLILDDPSDIDEEILSKLADQFRLTDKKVYENDYRHGIDKIEEIATRALSPGINDPNTAIHCIHKISLLLMGLSKIDNNLIIIEGNENVKIAYSSFTFEEDLYYSFNQIINYGKDDVDLMYTVFEGLETLYYSASELNKSKVLNFIKDIYENVLPPAKSDYSKKRLKNIYERIVLETNRKA